MDYRYDQNLWNSVLESISKNVDAKLIDTWLRPAKISADRSDNITIAVPNKFYKDWISKEYLPLIQCILKDECGIEGSVYVRVDESLLPKPKKRAKEEPSPQNDNLTPLDVSFTFENFVACASNALAHSAAVAVAEGNFSIYNPLYIYGDTGLGKTHLMYAVANRIRKNFPKMTILCMDCRTFTQEFIVAARSGSVEKLNEKLRPIDLFMLDDIQELEGKERTRLFFFDTFNDLQMKQKMVIMTSNESPQKIEMEERIRSRFASGIQAKINPPATEERALILMQKAGELGISLSDSHALFLAENAAAKNGRELIGVLKCIRLHSVFHNMPISEEIIKKALEEADLWRKHKKITSPQEIISIVSDMFSVKILDLTSKRKTQSIAYARQVAMYLLKERGHSLKEIGGYFNKDHSTVKYSVDNIKEKIKNDEYLVSVIGKIAAKISG